ncbi:putative RNA polymerase sigma factor WhiG [Streptomyces sp. Tu6071]|nr:putative RNA polymerase sigma factor WhiG [Streptomyces sp. Tu6071]
MELRFQRRVGAFDVARFLADGAGNPVEGAQFVDHGAANPGDRVRLELDGPLDVELLDRVDQPEDPGGDEVGLLDVGGQADADAPGDVLHEGRVVQDQLLAQARVPGRLVHAPQLVHRLGGAALDTVATGGGGSRRAVGVGDLLGHASPWVVLGRTGVFVCGVMDTGRAREGGRPPGHLLGVGVS